MKNKFLLFILSAISVAAFSQDDSSFRQPVQGDRTISFSFTGIATMALGLYKDPVNAAQMLDLRYFYKDDMAVRAGLGAKIVATSLATQNDTTGGVPLTETSGKVKTSAVSIAIGVEKHFKTRSKTIDPYLGPGIYVSTVGKKKENGTNRTTQANNDFTETETSTVTAGGFGIGIQFNAGFFWYFAQNIALGGEFALGYAYGRTGGEVVNTVTTTNSIGGTVTSTEKTKTTITKLGISGFQTMNFGTINLLVKF